MTLMLDTRQRAMLEEMGIHVWIPEAKLPPKPPAIPKSPVTPAVSARAAIKPIAESVKTTVPATVPATVSTPEPAVFAPINAQQADWFIVGDALNTPENQQALQLLDNMLKAAGISRAASGAHGAYLSDAAQHRTSSSVKPNPQELEHCRQFVALEIAAVRPRIIVAMGTFAIQLMLHEHPQQLNTPLDKQRGTIYTYQGIPVVPSYSPRALLRSGLNKAKAWADWCLALDRMERV